MTPFQGVLLFLSWLGAGILSPLISLILLSRGCALQTLPLALSIYSLTALLLEVPSGIFADWQGRKKTYLASVCLYSVSMLLLIPAHSFLGVAAAMAFQGAGRAFSSGSLDALIIDDAIARHGDTTLPRVTAQVTIIQNIGVALGALLSGFLPVTRGYWLQLALRIATIAATGLFGACFLREPPREIQGRSSFYGQLLQSRTLLRNHPAIWRIFSCMAALAGIMALVETYWQPALQAHLPYGKPWVFSLLCTSGFLLCTLGSVLSGRVPFADRRNRWNGYFFLQLLLGLSALLLACSGGIGGFLCSYLLFYALLGLSGVQEQTLLNGLSTNVNRATLLSAASLIAQLGAMFFNAASSPLVSHVSFSGVWSMAGLTLILVCTVTFLFHRRDHFSGTDIG